MGSVAATTLTTGTASPRPEIPRAEGPLGDAVWDIYWNDAKDVDRTISRATTSVKDVGVAEGIRNRLYDLQKLKENLSGAKHGVDLGFYRAFFADPVVKKNLSPKQLQTFMRAAANLERQGALRGAPRYKNTTESFPSTRDKYTSAAAYGSKAAKGPLAQQLSYILDHTGPVTTDEEFAKAMVWFTAQDGFKALPPQQQKAVIAGAWDAKKVIAGYALGSTSMLDSLKANAAKVPGALGAALNAKAAEYEARVTRGELNRPDGIASQREERERAAAAARQTRAKCSEIDAYLKSINGVTRSGADLATWAEKAVKYGDGIERVLAMPDGHEKDVALKENEAEAKKWLALFGGDPVGRLKAEKAKTEKIVETIGNYAGYIPGPVGQAAQFAFLETNLAYKLWAGEMNGREFAGKTLFTAIDSVIGNRIPGPEGRWLTEKLRRQGARVLNDAGEAASVAMGDPKNDTVEKKVRAAGNAVSVNLAKAYWQSLEEAIVKGRSGMSRGAKADLTETAVRMAQDIGLAGPELEMVRRKLAAIPETA